MRLALLVTLSLIASPALSQDIGNRTASPQSHLPAGALAPGQDDLSEAVAAAEAHPLGTLQNPIRVGGPQGERAYLRRLRCPDDSAPRIGQRSEGGVDTFGTITGAYVLACGVNTVQIFFDMYHEEHVEDRAPAGFTLEPR